MESQTYEKDSSVCSTLGSPARNHEPWTQKGMRSCKCLSVESHRRYTYDTLELCNIRTQASDGSGSYFKLFNMARTHSKQRLGVSRDKTIACLRRSQGSSRVTRKSWKECGDYLYSHHLGKQGNESRILEGERTALQTDEARIDCMPQICSRKVGRTTSTARTAPSLMGIPANRAVVASYRTPWQHMFLDKQVYVSTRWTCPSTS